MVVNEVWNLMQFLNQCQIGFEGDQIILTSEKWLRNKLTLNCEKNGEGRLVWRMASDTIPVNVADDLNLDKAVLIQVLIDIYKRMPSLREVFDNKVNELLARGENNEND